MKIRIVQAKRIHNILLPEKELNSKTNLGHYHCRHSVYHALCIDKQDWAILFLCSVENFLTRAQFLWHREALLEIIFDYEAMFRHCQTHHKIRDWTQWMRYGLVMSQQRIR